MGCEVWGLGFKTRTGDLRVTARVWLLPGFEVWGLRVWGLRVEGLGFGVCGLRCVLVI